MNDNAANLEASLKSIESILNDADQVLNKCPNLGGKNQYDIHEMQVEYYIENAFIQTLVLLDRLNLSRTYERLSDVFDKASKEGFTKNVYGIDDPYLVWSAVIYSYLEAIGTSYNVHPFTKIVSKDVESILRSTLYSITDKELFETPPENEREVHTRIEAVLRCVFPDLKHKPAISKPIKNFEPDTGLPSVRTLVEYKFISTQKAAKRISEEVLADSRGYYSRDWKQFIYVIYETRRIRPESEWKQLLVECGIQNNTQIIVLSGEPVQKGKKATNA